LRAAQFAIQLLNDLVTSRNTRSSVWDAQVELLQNFVHPGTRTKPNSQAYERSCEQQAQTRSDGDIPMRSSTSAAKQFVPMS
jgi:hypothetical protein